MIKNQDNLDIILVRSGIEVILVSACRFCRVCRGNIESLEKEKKHIIVKKESSF